MLITILRTNRWIPTAALILTVSFGIIIYDNWRTPGYVRRLEGIGYPINTTTLKTINPAIDEEQNANSLLYKAIAIKVFPFDLRKKDKPHLPTAIYSQSYLNASSPVELDEPYPIEQKQALKTLVDANHKAIELVHEASKYPAFFPIIEDRSFYKFFESLIFSYLREAVRLVASEGLHALLNDNTNTFIKDIDALLRLVRLFQQPDILAMPGEIGTTINITNSMIENALNRTEIPSSSLEHWLKELKQIALINNSKPINAIVHSGIKEILYLEVINFRLLFLENKWNSARLYLDFTGTWDNISKIAFPRMGNDFFHLIQERNSTQVLQLLARYRHKLHTLQTALPPADKSIWDSNFRNKYNGWQYDPIPSLYDDFRSLCYTKTISEIESYIYQSARASTAQTGIALYLYGQDHGRFPDTLQELVPKYLDAIPVNPFTEDAPINYRLEADRVVVYIEDKEISFTLLKKNPE